MGSATIEGRIDMGEKVIINIKTFMDGHKPPDRVLPSMLVSDLRPTASVVLSVAASACEYSLRDAHRPMTRVS